MFQMHINVAYLNRIPLSGHRHNPLLLQLWMLVVQDGLQAGEWNVAELAPELLLGSVLQLGEGWQALPQRFSLLVDDFEEFLSKTADFFDVSNFPRNQIKKLVKGIKGLHEEGLKYIWLKKASGW